MRPRTDPAVEIGPLDGADGGALTVAFTWLIRARATASTALALLAAFCVVLPAMLYLGVVSLSDRIDLDFGGRGVARVAEVDESWQTRSDSLRVGLNLVLDGGPATWVFGLGPGLTTPGVHKVAGYEAVWSVLLPYVYQTGFVGLAVVFLVAVYLFQIWRADGYSVAYPLVLGVWFVGITITTSYGQLLPLTVALGWITVWPSLCHSSKRKSATAPGSSPAKVVRRRATPHRRRESEVAITGIQPAAPRPRHGGHVPGPTWRNAGMEPGGRRTFDEKFLSGRQRHGDDVNPLSDQRPGIRRCRNPGQPARAA